MEKKIIEAMEDEFIPYAGELLVNNLPSVCDGLLPVNRKVIWALYKNGINPDKSFIKLLRAGAYTMVYYVFGDQPLYGAMKSMGNNSLNYLYLDPKGSFGDKRKKDGTGAAPRYIECRLSKYSKELLNGINKNNVEFKRNFDNTEYEPIVLPSMIPNVLVNPRQSIAVGEANKMPSFNLIEVCDGIIKYLETKNINDVFNIIKCPDLPLGGVIYYDKNVFKKIYETGRGSFSILGKYIYDKKKNMVTITEVPYETYIENIKEKLEEGIEKGYFKEVTDYHDGSDKDGIALKIYLKKNTNLNTFIAKLRKYTPFESKFACNFTLLDLDGKTPKRMNLKEIIDKWLIHRKQCIIKEFEYDINKNNIQLNKLYGLKIISENLDEAIKIIRNSKNEEESIKLLIKEFNLNQAQAEYISTIKLININQEWIKTKINNIKDLEEEVLKYTNLKEDNSYIENLISEQLKNIKQNFGMKRKTEIIYENCIDKISKEDLIEDYTCTLIRTKENYFKKTRKYSENQKTKENDKVIDIIQCNNKDKVGFFTNKGNLYYINVWEMTDCLPSNLGEYLYNLLPLEKEENIIGMITINSKSKDYVITTYENGKVSKTPIISYVTKNNRVKVGNALCLLNGNIISIKQILNDIDIKLIDIFNNEKVFNTSELSIKSSKNNGGIYMWNSKRKGFKIIDCIYCNN